MKLLSRFELILFVKYFLGYLLLLLPLMIFIFNGRALLAQLNWSLKQTLAVSSTQSQSQSQSSSIFNQLSASSSESFVYLPKIEVRAPIVFPDTTDNKKLLSWLEKGVIHYPDSAGFGEKGVAILLGHSSAYPWYRGNYGSVFALLEKLTPGDEVIVVSQGKKYLYRVSGSKVVVPKDFRVENPDGGAHLWLMSCWPVRTNKLRIVVATDLVRVEKI